MNFTEKEEKILRKALDKATPDAEASNAGTLLINSLRARGVTGYEPDNHCAAVAVRASSSLAGLCVAYMRRVVMIAFAIGLGAMLHVGAALLAAPHEKAAPVAELAPPRDYAKHEETYKGR